MEEGDVQFRIKQRIKVAAPLKLKDTRMKPYLSEEYMATINSNDHFVRNRISAGNTFYLGKVVSIDVYYMWQRKNGAPEWEDTNVLGTNSVFPSDFGKLPGGSDLAVIDGGDAG